MRWTWPSWLAVILGVVAVVAGIAMHHDSAWTGLSAAFIVAGGILVAAGLHGIQTAWSSCGDCCGYYDGCDCAHCEGCKSGDCCGKCSCYGAPEDPHAGHGHDSGHKH